MRCYHVLLVAMFSFQISGISVAVDCSGIIVKRASGFRSYPLGSACNGLTGEVEVGPSTVTFQLLAETYNSQNDDSVYYIYANSSTPITVNIAPGVHLDSLGIKLAYPGSASYVPFTSVSVDLGDCSSSHLLGGYVGFTSGTGCSVTGINVTGSCSLWIMGDLDGSLNCGSMGQTVIVRQLNGSINVNGDCGALNIGQPAGDYWGLQECAVR